VVVVVVVQDLLAANVERSFGMLSEEDWAKARFCKYAIETQALFHRISSPALPPPYAAPSGEAVHVWDQEWTDPAWQLTDANWHATALLAADLARYYHHHALHHHHLHHHHAPSAASVAQPPPGLLEEAWIDLTRHLRRDLPLGYVHHHRRRRRRHHHHHQPPPPRCVG
jgi:hypothetical protein